MRFTAVATAAIAFTAGAQAAVVDRQIIAPISISCVLDNNIISILKRGEEPPNPPCETPTGTTSWVTTTVTSTVTPYGGACPCTSGYAVKKRFIDERQIYIPVEVTCTLNDNIVTVGSVFL